jgi:hypothetical protein
MVIPKARTRLPSYAPPRRIPTRGKHSIALSKNLNEQQPEGDGRSRPFGAPSRAMLRVAG